MYDAHYTIVIIILLQLCNVYHTFNSKYIIFTSNLNIAYGAVVFPRDTRPLSISMNSLHSTAQLFGLQNFARHQNILMPGFRLETQIVRWEKQINHIPHLLG